MPALYLNYPTALSRTLIYKRHMRYLFLRRILPCMRPHAPTLLLYMCPPTSKACVSLRRILLCMRLHAPTLLLYYTCVLILGKVCVILRRILLYMRLHAPTLLLYYMCTRILVVY
jgi:hypothetical protein